MGERPRMATQDLTAEQRHQRLQQKQHCENAAIDPNSVGAFDDSSDEIDSPLFNCHNTDDDQSVSHFSDIDNNDDIESDLGPPRDEELDSYVSRRTVLAASNVDDLNEEDFIDSGKDFKKSPVDTERLIEQIRSVILFDGYDDDELQLVASYMYNRPTHKDEVIIEHGSEGDAFYVVQCGIFNCTLPDGSDGQPVSIKMYNNVGYFGELALVNQAPRAATITASSDGSLWVLNALRYAWLKKNRAMLNAERFEQVIHAIPMFRENLNSSLTNRLIDAIEVVNMASGDVICRKGDPGDAMYFIMDGEVEALIGNRRVKLMKRNDFFGERALILCEGRAATCCTTTKTKLAKLPKESFNLLIPDAVVEKMRHHIVAKYTQALPSASEDLTDDEFSTVEIEYCCKDVNRGD